jgi:hypothetical protein
MYNANIFILYKKQSEMCIRLTFLLYIKSMIYKKQSEMCIRLAFLLYIKSKVKYE